MSGHSAGNSQGAPRPEPSPLCRRVVAPITSILFTGQSLIALRRARVWTVDWRLRLAGVCAQSSLQPVAPLPLKQHATFHPTPLAHLHNEVHFQRPHANPRSKSNPHRPTAPRACPGPRPRTRCSCACRLPPTCAGARWAWRCTPSACAWRCGGSRWWRAGWRTRGRLMRTVRPRGMGRGGVEGGLADAGEIVADGGGQ